MRTRELDFMGVKLQVQYDPENVNRIEQVRVAEAGSDITPLLAYITIGNIDYHLQELLESEAQHG